LTTSQKSRIPDKNSTTISCLVAANIRKAKLHFQDRNPADRIWGSQFKAAISQIMHVQKMSEGELGNDELQIT